MLIVQITREPVKKFALDAWSEGDHPRGPDGKFISGSGEGGAVTPKDIAKAYGLTDVQPGTIGDYTAGKINSHDVDIYNDGSWGVYNDVGKIVAEGKNHTSLTKKLKELSGTSTPEMISPPEHSTEGKSSIQVAEAHPALSHMSEDPDEGTAVYETADGLEVHVHDSTSETPGAWEAIEPDAGSIVDSGDDAKSLEAYLSAKPNAPKDTDEDSSSGKELTMTGPQEDALAAASTAAGGQFSNMKNDGGFVSATNPAGDTLNVSKDGLWEIIDTQGKLKNEGKGGDALAEYLKKGAAPAAPTLSPKQQNYIVNSHVGKIISAAGFKKVKSSDGTLQFQNQAGAKIVVHPPAPDKKSSSKWTLHGEGQEKQGEGIALAKVLAQVTGQPAPQAAAAPTPSSTAPSQASVAEAYGYTKGYVGETGTEYNGPNNTVISAYNDGSWVLEEKGKSTPLKMGKTSQELASALLDLKLKAGNPLDNIQHLADPPKPKAPTKVSLNSFKAIVTPTTMVKKSKNKPGYHFAHTHAGTVYYNTSNASWAVKKYDGTPEVTGTGNQALADHLAKTAKPASTSTVPAPAPSPHISPAVTAAANTAKVHKDFEPYVNAAGKGDVHTYLTDKGYGSSAYLGDDITAYTKPDGSKVEVNGKTGEWLAKTPNHMTKTGTGASNLAHLLSGEKQATYTQWANTDKASIYQSPEQKAAEAAAKEAKAAAAKAAEEAQKKAMGANAGAEVCCAGAVA